MALLSNPVKTAGRYSLAISGGAVALLSVVALFSKDGGKAADAIKSIAESLSSISMSLAALAGTAAALYAGIRGTLNSTPQAIQAAVAERPDKMVVTVDANEDPARVAMKLSSLPEVKAVITNSEVAAATPQVAKIVGPEDPAAQ